MTLYSHRINAQEHRSFLEEKRLDPITGERFQEGDELVFCASCKSAFFLDSWNYLEQQHCEQSQTLASIPISTTLSIQRRLDTLLFEGNKQWTKNVALTFIGSAVVAAIALYILSFSGLLVVGALLGSLIKSYGARGHSYSIFSNGLQVCDKQKTSIWLSEIEKVEFKPLSSFYFRNGKAPKVVVKAYLKNGKMIRLVNPEDEMLNKKILFAFAKLSQKVKVELHLRYKRDIDYAKHLVHLRDAQFEIVPVRSFLKKITS